jgi:hypothetical protein
MKERSLEERIRDLGRECERYVHDQAVLVSKGTGVPSIAVESQLMMAGRGSVFQAALLIIDTKRRDEELVRRQAVESKQSKPAA